MPHKCVKCNRFFDDRAEEVIEGCECGSKVFMYVKKQHLEASGNVIENGSGAYDINIHGILGITSENPSGQYEIDIKEYLKR